MKKLLIFALLLMLIACNGPQKKTHTQSIGVNFYHDLDSALIAAKENNKLVFADFYTSWCGPCRKMAKEVLSTKEAGALLNDDFVCVKIQCDDKGVGEQLLKKYHISGFPTLSILDADGKVIHTNVGSLDIDGLKKFMETAADVKNNLCALLKDYQEGARDTATIRKYYNTLLKYEMRKQYANSLQDYLLNTPKKDMDAGLVFELLTRQMPAPGTGAFTFYETNFELWSDSISQKDFNQKVKTSYAYYLRNLAIYEVKQYEIEIEKFKAKNYSYTQELIDYFGIYLSTRNTETNLYDVDKYVEAGDLFFKKYGYKNKEFVILTAQLLGNLANPEYNLEKAFKWMDEAIKLNGKSNFYHTYIYLSWRNGKHDQAIDWCKDAISKNKDDEQLVKYFNEKIKYIEGLKEKDEEETNLPAEATS